MTRPDHDETIDHRHVRQYEYDVTKCARQLEALGELSEKLTSLTDDYEKAWVASIPSCEEKKGPILQSTVAWGSTPEMAIIRLWIDCKDPDKLFVRDAYRDERTHLRWNGAAFIVTHGLTPEVSV